MHHQHGHFKASDGTDIFYQAWLPDGEPKATWLMIHGLGEHSSRYQNYVDALVPKGYALYTSDLRGHGRSGGRRGHVNRFDDYLADVQQLREQIGQTGSGGRLFLFGHSFGSLVALTYALRHPEGLAAVLVTGTALRDALPYPEWVRKLLRRSGQMLPTLTLPSGIKHEYLSRDAAVVEAYKRDPLVHSKITLRWAAEAIAIREWLYAQAPQWRLPLLMQHGQDDRICLPEGARLFYEQATNPQIEYRQYDGMYHEIHNEFGKEGVFKDIEEWVQRKL